MRQGGLSACVRCWVPLLRLAGRGGWASAVAVLVVAEGGVGKGRSCNWTLTSNFSCVLPRMSMQQSSFALAGVGRICLIRGGGSVGGEGASGHLGECAAPQMAPVRGLT